MKSSPRPSGPLVKNTSLPLDRRQFLARTATGLGAAALWSALGTRTWAATSASVSDAPETTDLNFGMIALTDCSPIVIAHEKGLFKKYGINSKVTKGANWAAIRDNLSSGSIQATHMLIGMPLASTMGLAGSPRKPMIIPWLMNRNGQAITLKSEWKGKVGADPKALQPFVAPSPSLSTESRLGAPLLAQEASYLAASARISSLSLSSIANKYCIYKQYIANRSRRAVRERTVARFALDQCVPLTVVSQW
jgi:hypothetical protein